MKNKPPKFSLLPAEFKNIYSKVPRLCVDLIIKNEGGIVFSKRNIPPVKGKWHLPGGTVFFGEKIIDSINRVVEEETGLQVRVEKMLGVIEFSPESESSFGHPISIVYLVVPIKGELRGSWQGKEIDFFSEIPHDTIKEHAEFVSKQEVWL